jgi:WD40 repeat protein
MGLFQKLSCLATKQVLAGACKVVGLEIAEVGFEKVSHFLTERFTDHSQRLPEALRKASERAWTTLEVALEGESLWRIVDRAEDKAMRQQVRTFLDATPLAGLPGHGDEFRQQCLRELRAARKSGLLHAGGLDLAQLAQQTAGFARFAEPQEVLSAEWRAIDHLADELRQSGHATVAYFITLRAGSGDQPPLLVAAVRYFFRREVETDAQLFQGLAWANLEALRQQTDAGFAALAEHAEALQRLLTDVQQTVQATHGAVLDIQGEQHRQGQQLGDLYQAVIDLKRRFDLDAVQVRPGDSLALTGDLERRLVREVLGRFRALPPAEQQRLPALLNSLAQLEVAAGDLDGAQRDFREVAGLVSDRPARAEAQHNLFTAALEKHDLAAALDALKEAAQLDPERFAPFPLAKYEPEKVLGAGGFGIALLCRNRHSGSRVVVKTLRLEMLERHVADVFREARVLEELDHPAVIRLRDCDYADQAQTRPYLVMDYFDGPTLAAYLQQHGKLSADDLRALAVPVAEALAAAHARGIFHRDVKPANLLVRREGEGWRVKLIDFGLAMKQRSQTTATAARSQTTYSAGGTAEYAAPEQLGRLPGTPVGPYTDVYGFGKTCCQALFGTTQPLRKHWRELPEDLADLLEQCLVESPQERIANFEEVLKRLRKPGRSPQQTEAPAPPAGTEPQWWRTPPRGTTAQPPDKQGRVLTGHTDAVLCVAFAPDGRHALSGGADRTLRWWNLQSGENVALEGHTDRVWCVQVLPDGKHAVSAGADRTVRVWDLTKGQELRRFENRTNRAVAVSPDGQYAVSGSTTDGMVRYWHLETGREIRRLKGHMSWVRTLAFLADGRHVVSAAADGTARLWDVETGAEVRRLQGHQGSIHALAVQGAGRHALTSGDDRSVRLWDLKSGKQLRGFPNGGYVVEAVALTSNGQLGVWECAHDETEVARRERGQRGTLALVDVQSGKSAGLLHGHQAAVTCIALAPEKLQILTGSADHSLRLWRSPAT